MYSLSLGIEDTLKYSWIKQHSFIFKRWLARIWNWVLFKILDLTYHRLGVSRFKKLERSVWYPNTGFEVAQIKEKFGSLNFYYDIEDDITDEQREAIHKLVRNAENYSLHICEVCGDLGFLRTKGWYQTLCTKHAKPHQYCPNEMEEFRKTKPLEYMKWLHDQKKDK
jgi:hypothetical protein